MFSRDHPRTCGENTPQKTKDYEREGSPPHLRGKHSSDCFKFFVTRITPAPAGKTELSQAVLFYQQDHPRTCGENPACTYACNSVRGSPPHLRGKLHLGRKTEEQEGITPAPAGKTRFLLRIHIELWDHPRTCGENVLYMSSKGAIRGSPPHLRGKLFIYPLPTAKSRITPAPAGKTIINNDKKFQFRDHPRTCGENVFRCAIGSNL